MAPYLLAVAYQQRASQRPPPNPIGRMGRNSALIHDHHRGTAAVEVGGIPVRYFPRACIQVSCAFSRLKILNILPHPPVLSHHQPCGHGKQGDERPLQDRPQPGYGVAQGVYQRQDSGRY